MALQLQEKNEGPMSSSLTPPAMAIEKLYVAVHPCHKGDHRPQREVDHILRTGTFTDRTDVQTSAAFNLPTWASDPLDFFEACEAGEQRSGRWAYQLITMVPRTLDVAHAVALLDGYRAQWLPHFAGCWAIHELEDAKTGHRQPHAHTLFSPRLLADGIERSREQFGKRYDPRHPSWGGARKDPGVSSRNWQWTMQRRWCE